MSANYSSCLISIPWGTAYPISFGILLPWQWGNSWSAFFCNITFPQCTEKTRIPSNFLFLLNFFISVLFCHDELTHSFSECLCHTIVHSVLNCISVLVVNCCADKASLSFWTTFSLSLSPFLSSWLILERPYVKSRQVAFPSAGVSVGQVVSVGSGW